MARIMIVDDVASMRQIMRALLENAGHRVTEAASAPEAVDLAKVKRNHLVITDVNMPGMSGLELIGALRSVSGYANTPVLICANDSADENIQKARDLGASGWVAKPFKPENLIGVVNQVLVDYYVNN